MHLKISKGNSKLGRIPNISFSPVLSCVDDAPCFSDCYAIKAWRMYPLVRKSWYGNYSYWMREPLSFQSEMKTWFSKNEIQAFRWFVAGDIPDENFLEVMRDIACEFKTVRFLCFTKRHELNFMGLPDNLQIILSMWPGWGDVSSPRRRAWMQDGTETRIPENVISCLGTCDRCFTCFYLNELGRDVVMKKH